MDGFGTLGARKLMAETLPPDTSDTTNHMWTTLGLMRDLSCGYFLDTYGDLMDNTVDCSLHQSAESNRTVA